MSMHRKQSLRTGCRLLAGLALCLGGCAMRTPHVTSAPVVPADGNAELMEYIADQPFVTAEAAYRAVWLMIETEPYSGSFDDLTHELVQRKIAADSWHYAPDQTINNGTAAYLICRAAKINSSINFALTGLGRYAWKELQYRRIAEVGSESNLTTGGAFLAMLSKTDDYLHEMRRAPDQRSELGHDPSAGESR